MYSDKSHLKLHFVRNVLLALLLVMIFASLTTAAERRLGAVAATQQRSQASNQAASNLGAGGSAGYDLRAISSPRSPQTMTGFPAGTLPGDSRGGQGNEIPAARVAMSGDPLLPVIGPEMIGRKLNQICVIADHVGYSVGRRAFSPTVMDTPYTFALMNGNRKIATLFFNNSMTLVMIE